ncbi:hypothetical protein MtrunA17_Chr8g0379651 [Medicago truncatula]|uniref:Uncharacterized protein n=1 Tax=Medicago truncatula TaxID=3880 RepID=G7L795_MEDTR|nr:hypothetical protein MTR_8g087480 [Medicago truncatula]RHN42682.1 hypothetical protein MtrunA17_Chr8g0379651 [Medicago truncatula]
MTLPYPYHHHCCRCSDLRGKKFTEISDGLLQYFCCCWGMQEMKKSTEINVVDGSKIMKVFFDPKDRNNTAIYRKLSGKDVVFSIPLLRLRFCFSILILFHELHMVNAIC